MPAKALYQTLLFTTVLTVAPYHSQAGFETAAKHAYLIDHSTNTLLFDKDGQAAMPPSSMTKLMTVYILLDHIKKGSLSLTDSFTTSEKAWRKQGSKMFLDHKEKVTVEELLYGILVQSGNDAAIVVAESLAVSEAKFAKLMNETAKKLGLTQTHFVNATGWPDDTHTMSAKDITLLSQRIIEDFPEYYHYFSKEEFSHNNIKQKNRNSLLGKVIGVDGLKTGYTDIGGYGIAISAQNNGRRIIGVLNGLNSEKERHTEAARFLNYGFEYFENKTFYTAGEVITEAPTWLGKDPTVELVSKQDITLSTPIIADEKDIQINVSLMSPIAAPIDTNTQIATLKITIPEVGNYSYPLYAAKKIQPVGWIKKTFSVIHFYIKEHL